MKAPNFKLPDQNGKIHSLEEYKGKWLLIYFYPKDDTPGCTKEACNFRDTTGELKKRNTEVIGISKDSVKSHTKFSQKYQLPFPILADPEHTVIEAYGAWGLKTFLGKTFEGTHRNSYLVDPNGEIVKEYIHVNPLTHSAQVLRDLDDLQK